MIVYLCGGINGLSDSECRDWREIAKSLLHAETRDPMRRDYRGIEDAHVTDIVVGDLADINDSDFVLMNATRPSWGTGMEAFYAASKGKKVVAWVGERGSIRVSPWLRYFCVEIHESLTKACESINAKIAAPQFPTDPASGRSFDGHYDDLLPCGCVEFYRGGRVRCESHR